MTGFFDIDLGLGDDVGSARKGKHRINTDVGINKIDMSLDLGNVDFGLDIKLGSPKNNDGLSNDEFGLNLGLGSSQGNGISDIAKDITSAVDDFKKGYNFMKSDIQGIKGAVGPGAGLLKGDVKKCIGFLKKRFGKKDTVKIIEDKKIG